MPGAEQAVALEVAHARIEERVERLEEDRRKQNGTLQRLEEKLDRFTWWLVITLGGVATSLILLVINLGSGR